MSRLAWPLTLAALALGHGGAHGRELTESSRSNSLEFKVGAYQPRIDSQFKVGSVAEEASLPYKRLFNNDNPFMLVFGIDQHILKTVGTLSMGATVGWWSVEGKGVSEDAEGGDTTSLRMIPIQAQLTYRLDLWEQIVPLVPVLRGGLDYISWSIKDGSGDTARFPTGSEAAGGTWGWHVTAGVHFLLDYLDPGMAADFDRDAGVNGSYLVFEWQYSKVDDFGAADSFRLGDSAFFIGLALDL